MKEKSAAILTIKEAHNMTEQGRKEIAKWIRDQADSLEQHGENYSKKFTGRYLYVST